MIAYELSVIFVSQDRIEYKKKHKNSYIFKNLYCWHIHSYIAVFLSKLSRKSLRMLTKSCWLTHEGTSRTAKSLLDQDYIHSIGLNEQWKSLEWFAFLSLRFWDIVFLLYFLSKSCGPPQVHRKIEFRISTWNFAQMKVSMRLVYPESFTAFSFFKYEIRA
jgi:hypothetical protein